MASSKTTLRTSSAAPAPELAPFIDLDCHVLPLLAAIEWMGHASNKLTDIEAMKNYAPEMGGVDSITGPENLNAADLMSGVAWVAAGLLRRYQKEQCREQVGGSA